MKKVILVLFVGFFALSINAQTEEEIKKDFKGPIFQFENEVIDYGEIAQNSDGNRVFKFKNIGKSPLIITSIKASCGCTVPTKPEEPIMPGEIGEVKVKYATNRVGPFAKSITINSNAFISKKVLRIKGRVLETKNEENLQKQKSMVSEKN